MWSISFLWNITFVNELIVSMKFGHCIHPISKRVVLFPLNACSKLYVVCLASRSGPWKLFSLWFSMLKRSSKWRSNSKSLMIPSTSCTVCNVFYFLKRERHDKGNIQHFWHTEFFAWEARSSFCSSCQIVFAVRYSVRSSNGIFCLHYNTWIRMYHEHGVQNDIYNTSFIWI